VKVVTAAEMREIDRLAIEKFGVPSLDLMERAGAGAAELLVHVGLERGGKVTVICGKGNNAGDGFVAARYLKNWGASPTCWVISERDELTADTLRNIVKAEDAGVSIRRYEANESPEEFAEELSEASFIIDAMLGTGAKGKLREPIRGLARLLNASGKRILALDIPTGMDADSGGIDPDCVRATFTATFGFPKRGMYVRPGREVCGDVVVVDLEYPEESVGVTTGVLLWSEMPVLLPERDPRGHKGMFGRALVIAGSTGLTGAACLASEGALRSGTGLVKLLVPQRYQPVCATRLTEIMTYGLPESKRGTFCAASVAAALPFIEEADAVLLGPGLSSLAPARNFVRQLLPLIDKPLVLDADGLNAIAGDDSEAADVLAEIPAILTPHPGELSRLLGMTIEELLRDQEASARLAAETFGCEVIFKGAPSLIASPDGEADLCSLGNDGMATAGSGDVLAGILVGLLAQGMPADEAARLGTMVHSRAGDIAAGEFGRRGMIAGDMLRALPYVWRELEGEGTVVSGDAETPESQEHAEEDADADDSDQVP
jgi:hydroxyethylthiazole kinase-like uncharacterized protein yjeF